MLDKNRRFQYDSGGKRAALHVPRDTSLILCISSCPIPVVQINPLGVHVLHYTCTILYYTILHYTILYSVLYIYYTCTILSYHVIYRISYSDKTNFKQARSYRGVSMQHTAAHGSVIYKLCAYLIGSCIVRVGGRLENLRRLIY